MEEGDGVYCENIIKCVYNQIWYRQLFHFSYVCPPEMLTFIEGWILGSNHQANLPTNIFLLFLAPNTWAVFYTNISSNTSREIFQAERILIIIIIIIIPFISSAWETKRPNNQIGKVWLYKDWY